MEGKSYNKSEKELILATNHRYFTRQTVSAICRWLLTGFVTYLLVAIAAATIGALTNGVNLTEAVELSTGEMVTVAICSIAAFCLVVFYLLYTIIAIIKIVRLHKVITRVEGQLVEDSISAKYC